MKMPVVLANSFSLCLSWDIRPHLPCSQTQPRESQQQSPPVPPSHLCSKTTKGYPESQAMHLLFSLLAFLILWRKVHQFHPHSDTHLPIPDKHSLNFLRGFSSRERPLYGDPLRMTFDIKITIPQAPTQSHNLIGEPYLPREPSIQNQNMQLRLAQVRPVRGGGLHPQHHKGKRHILTNSFTELPPFLSSIHQLEFWVHTQRNECREWIIRSPKAT